MKKNIVVLAIMAGIGLASMAIVTAEGIDPAVAETVKKIQTQLNKDIDANPGATDGVKAFARDFLLPICANKVFAAEVKKQNAAKVALDEIKNIDKQWIGAENELPIHKEKLEGPCGLEVKKVAQNLPAIVEMFVMDNQGANVGQNKLTSDYWQGDEPKWQNSYKNGQGGVEIGKVELDKSSNVELQQISLPIIDETGTVVGAVCFGVKKDFAEVLGKLGQEIDKTTKASDKVKEFVRAKLLGQCTNDILVKETAAQNGKGMSMDEIKKIDEQWTKAEDELAIQKEKKGNPCATELLRIVAGAKSVVEVFAMDNQGGNVGQNILTSDYWQGDEPKWQNSFNNGQGGLDVGDIKLDKSSNVQTQQVSLPLYDKQAKVIGAVCWGINVEKIPDGSTALQLAMLTDIK